MSYCLAYMTAATAADARTIGRALVRERLAACVNVVPGMTSIYRWNDAVEEESEVVLIAKTTSVRFDALARRVEQMHGYDNPCVIRLDIRDGLPAFLEWIGAETSLPAP